MANKNFKVRFGLDIGDNVSVTDAGVATGLTSITSTTVDVSNLETTNIKALDGTAAATIANSTGIITVSTELNVDNLNISGNTITSTNSNGNITLTPNGTGDVILSADTVQVGDSNATATITTNGTGDLVLNTNSGTNAGSITLANGANNNITLAPNGTGDVLTTFSNGGNLFNNRNYVFGAIRNATTESIGDIWAVNSTGPTLPYRGISLDNSADTAKGPGTILRAFSGGAVQGTRGRLVFEKARGTSASPTAVQSGDFIGSVDATGYTSTGFINDNIVSFVPGFFGFQAAENWISNTNLGTTFTLALAPQNTTITSGTQNVGILNLSAESSTIRGDRLSIGQGKVSIANVFKTSTTFTATGCSTSGTTLTIGTLTAGTIFVGQVLNAGNAINGHYIVANISGSGSGSTWQLSGSPGTFSGQAITGNLGYIGSVPETSTTTDILQDLRLLTNKIKSQGGTTQITTSSAGATLALAGDQINLQTAAAASIVGNNINYNRVYGQWQNLNLVTPAANNTAYAFALPTIDFANIASINTTSRIVPGAAGVYKLQFSVQVRNDDAAAEHIAYFWWRKNGTDVPGSMGRVGVPKAAGAGDALTIAGWDNMISSANTTDYWELMYAVDDAAHIDFPTFTATAFGPATAALFVTLVPVGA